MPLHHEINSTEALAFASRFTLVVRSMHQATVLSFLRVRQIFPGWRLFVWLVFLFPTFPAKETSQTRDQHLVSSLSQTLEAVPLKRNKSKNVGELGFGIPKKLTRRSSVWNWNPTNFWYTHLACFAVSQLGETGDWAWKISSAQQMQPHTCTASHKNDCLIRKLLKAPQVFPWRLFGNEKSRRSVGPKSAQINANFPNFWPNLPPTPIPHNKPESPLIHQSDEFPCPFQRHSNQCPRVPSPHFLHRFSKII